MKKWLSEVMDIKKVEDEGLDFKDLERERGFLVYLSRTYTSMVPYLKGIHLTLDSWRSGRDKDGWKIMGNTRRISEEEKENFTSETFTSSAFFTNSELKPPKRVMPVPRLIHDLRVLNEFFESEVPPWRFVRGSKIFVAKYGFGDASKSGFGSTFITDGGISYRYGTWGSDGRESSSNFRELENLAQSLEEEVTKNGKTGREVFLFTDNSTA